MSETLLEEIQRLPTSGARAVVPFIEAGRTFLAVPQLAEDLPGRPADMNGGNSDIDTVIYEWRDGGFVELQRLPSHGAEDAEFFHIGARAFLAIACIRSGRGPYAMNTRSLLFEWREGRFVAFQELASFAAKQWRHFSVGDRHFLALAQGVATEARDAEHGFDHFRVDGRPLRAVPDAALVVGLQLGILHARGRPLSRFGGSCPQLHALPLERDQL